MWYCDNEIFCSIYIVEATKICPAYGFLLWFIYEWFPHLGVRIEGVAWGAARGHE
jgi:hypothetical protein